MTKRTLKVKQTTNNTDTKTQGSWKYNKLQIDLDKLKQIRVAIYDNEPGEKHQRANGRYRAELQLWCDKDISEVKGEYKLVNKLSNWSNFRQNQYKKDDDVYADWYKENVAFVKEYMAEHHDVTVLACPLGAQQNNADGQRGYAHVPKYMLMYITDGISHACKLFMDDLEHNIQLNEETPVGEGNDGRPAICYYQREEVACE